MKARRSDYQEVLRAGAGDGVPVNGLIKGSETVALGDGKGEEVDVGYLSWAENSLSIDYVVVEKRESVGEKLVIPSFDKRLQQGANGCRGEGTARIVGGIRHDPDDSVLCYRA